MMTFAELCEYGFCIRLNNILYLYLILLTPHVHMYTGIHVKKNLISMISFTKHFLNTQKINVKEIITSNGSPNKWHNTSVWEAPYVRNILLKWDSLIRKFLPRAGCMLNGKALTAKRLVHVAIHVHWPLCFLVESVAPPCEVTNIAYIKPCELLKLLSYLLNIWIYLDCLNFK